MILNVQNYLTRSQPTKLAWRLHEIATATGFSISFLRKKEREGELRTRNVGRCKIVLTEDLLSFLNGAEDQSSGEGESSQLAK